MVGGSTGLGAGAGGAGGAAATTVSCDGAAGAGAVSGAVAAAVWFAGGIGATPWAAEVPPGAGGFDCIRYQAAPPIAPATTTTATTIRSPGAPRLLPADSMSFPPRARVCT